MPVDKLSTTFPLATADIRSSQPEEWDVNEIEKQASNRVRQITESSPFFLSNPPRKLPLYVQDEVKTGKILGQGQFCTVQEVTEVTEVTELSSDHLKDFGGLVNSMHSIGLMDSTKMEQDEAFAIDETEHGQDEEEEDCCFPCYRMSEAREILIKRCFRDGRARYAVKCLREDIEGEEKVTAMMDLAMEAKFLASLAHSNIVRLRGVVGAPGRQDFKLLLDRLFDTLEDKFALWKTVRQRSSRGFFRRRESKLLSKNLLVEQMIAAYDIARVLTHLHANRIIYRDLKPENMAYDIRGDLRIFDFGLAREVTKEHLIQSPEDYACTGMTGSRRWMAPEVYLLQPYGPSADVYSYGLVCWNIFSLKVPYGRISIESHYKKVVMKGKRPSRIGCLSPIMMNMMRNCWSSDRSKRPIFPTICSIIKSELERLEAGDGKVLDRSLHLDAKSEKSAECCA